MHIKTEKFIRSRFVIAGFVLILFVAFAIRGTIAWLVTPGESAADGIEMSGVELPFYVRVAEQNDTSYWESYKALIKKADAGLSEGDEEEEADTHYYKTGSESDGLIWRLDSTETQDVNGIYTTGIRPGAAGTLKFEIVPTKSGDFAVDATFNIRGFTAEYPNDEEIREGADSNVPKELNEIVVGGQANAATDALNYINGHILFFAEEEDGIYSGFMETYHQNITNAEKGTAIPVELHWVWVNTIDQILLKTGDGGTDVPIIASDNSVDRSSLLSYVKNNYS